MLIGMVMVMRWQYKATFLPLLGRLLAKFGINWALKIQIIYIHLFPGTLKGIKV